MSVNAGSIRNPVCVKQTATTIVAAAVNLLLVSGFSGIRCEKCKEKCLGSTSIINLLGVVSQAYDQKEIGMEDKTLNGRRVACSRFEYR